MRSRLLALGGVVAFLSTAAVVGVRAQTGGTPAPPPPARRGSHKERHPELMRAMRALQRARGDLQAAARDFGGHRTKAQELTEQAIKEVQAAIQFDKS